MSDDVLVLTRRFACAPEALFDHWLDPAVRAEQLSKRDNPGGT